MIGLGALLALVKGASITKKVASVGSLAVPALRWIGRYWELIVIGLLVVALGFVSWSKNRTIADLALQLESSTALLATVEGTIARNDAALQQCLAINRENAWAYEVMHKRAEQAEQKAREMARASTHQIEVINDESKQLRGRDVDCRRLDDPLPDWFDDWLRQ